jgi:hypothetical protein
VEKLAGIVGAVLGGGGEREASEERAGAWSSTAMRAAGAGDRSEAVRRR